MWQSSDASLCSISLNKQHLHLRLPLGPVMSEETQIIILANDLYTVLYCDRWCAENLFQWLPRPRSEQRGAVDRPLTLEKLTSVKQHLSPGLSPVIDGIPAVI